MEYKVIIQVSCTRDSSVSGSSGSRLEASMVDLYYQECAQQTKSPSPGQIAAPEVFPICSATGQLQVDSNPQNKCTLTRIQNITASLPPQTLCRCRLSQTRLDNTSHDILGIIGTGPVALKPCVWRPLPLVDANTLVKTNAITAPFVGATSTNATYLGWLGGRSTL